MSREALRSRSAARATRRFRPRWWWCVSLGAFAVWASTGCLVLSEFEDAPSEDASVAPSATVDATQRRGNACEAGQFSCVLDELRVCMGGRWMLQQTCAAGDYCSPDLGACLRCKPNAEHRCSDGQLQRCAATGTEFVVIADCESADKACDTSVSVDACVDCAVPDRRCLDGALQRCVQGRFDAGVPCTIGACQQVDGRNDYCAQCTDPGQEACGADERVLCGEGLRWELLEQCPQGCASDDGATRCL